MCAHEPGLFTSTIPTTVRPRKTSSETRRFSLRMSTVRRFRRFHRFRKNKTTVLQATTTEVKEQANLVTRSLEIVDYLRLFSPAHVRQSFQLNNDRIEADKICA